MFNIQCIIFNIFMLVHPPLLVTLLCLYNTNLYMLINRPISFIIFINPQQNQSSLQQQTRFVLRPPRLVLQEPQLSSSTLLLQQQPRVPQIDPRRRFEQQNNPDQRRVQQREENQPRQRESRLNVQHRRRNNQ